MWLLIKHKWQSMNNDRQVSQNSQGKKMIDQLIQGVKEMDIKNNGRHDCILQDSRYSL